MQEKNIKILTYGTFDTLHYGHINLLKRAKELGNHLTVGVSSNEFNVLKGKNHYHSFQERCEFVKAISYVDEIIPELNWQQKQQDIIKYNIDIFVMGDDWQGKFDFLQNLCKIIYLPRTKFISTTAIKEINHKQCS